MYRNLNDIGEIGGEKLLKDFGTLRAIREDEVELMRSWRNAPSVRANMYSRHEISEQEHRIWWERTKNDKSKKYFIYEMNNTPSGVVSFTYIDKVNKNSSWAFYAAPDSPRGTGTKMEFQALEYVFSQMNFYKLYCEVLSSNMPVIRLHKKFGFQIEGVFRGHHMLSGNFIDIYRLGILANEWGAKRNIMAAKIAAFR